MILVDPRIGSGDLLDPLAKRLNGQAKLVTLGSGDVGFEGNGPIGTCSVGIELKKIGDLLNCLRSGRFAGYQLPNMMEDYNFCYLIVEGLFRPNDVGLLETWAHGNWEPMKLGKSQYFYYAELDKFLATVELQKNVVVKRATTRLETVWQIVNLYNWFQKPWEEHHSAEQVKVQVGLVTKRASLCRMVAAQLPGIGWGRAAGVDKKFGTVEAMVNAGVSDWQKIEGIGKKTAVKVYEAMRQ